MRREVPRRDERPGREPISSMSANYHNSHRFCGVRVTLLSVKAIDVHQHLWPDAVLGVLETRSSAPRALRREGRWEVRPADEPSFEIDPRDHDPERRVAGLEESGVDTAVVALSAPVGIEGLPAPEALSAVSAWTAAAAELPSPLDWWASVPSEVSLDEQIGIVADALARGAAGLCLSAGRLAYPAVARRNLPLLRACAEAGAPVFVHPGRSAGGPEEEPWWPPATRYVAQQHAAWHAFHAVIRGELPEVRVIFALLAGLAPLHLERTVRRGGTEVATALADPLSFYEVSSYGPRAIRAMVCAVGVGQLVHGTDYPVVDDASDPVAEALGPGRAELVRRDGPSRALGYGWVPT
jgi:6-methylsalicylate decarboxylase